MDNFEESVFHFLDSFFCLIHFAADTLYCIFHFIHCILYLSISILWFFLMISIRLLNFSFCLWMFTDFTELCFCFLVAHWASLKQLFWILYWVFCRSPCLWGQLLEDYCNTFVVSCFLAFSLFEVLSCLLNVLSRSHFLQSLLTLEKNYQSLYQLY